MSKVIISISAGRKIGASRAQLEAIGAKSKKIPLHSVVKPSMSKPMPNGRTRKLPIATKEVIPKENREKILALKAKIKDLEAAHKVKVKDLEAKMKALGHKKAKAGIDPKNSARVCY